MLLKFGLCVPILFSIGIRTVLRACAPLCCRSKQGAAEIRHSCHRLTVRGINKREADLGRVAQAYGFSADCREDLLFVEIR
jgi:hypothetical protein